MLRRVPLPLGLILTAAVVAGVAWIVVMPAMQTPDEDSHYGYVEKLVEAHTLPWPHQPAPRPGDRGPLSTQALSALVQSGLQPLINNIQARPLWTSVDQAYERSHAEALPDSKRRDGGHNAAGSNPPAYYFYAAVPYVVASGGSFWDRIELMRLANLLPLLVLVIFTWLITARLVPDPPWARYIGAASVALIPTVTQAAATINPDLFMAAEWAAALYVMVLVLQDGPTRGRLLWLAGLTILALLTHPRSLPLLIPVALTFGFIFFARSARRRLWVTAGVWGMYLVGVFVAVSQGAAIPRQFASYVWQFYLPRLPGMTPSIGPPNYDFGELYVSHFYGSLASTEVEISYPLERVLFWATILGLIALVVVLIRQRVAVRAQAPLAIVLASTVLALILGLHVGAYRAMVGNPSDPVLTGRYLLPLLPLFGAGIGLVTRYVPRRAGVVVAAVILGGGIVLQFWSLGHVLERFYA